MKRLRSALAEAGEAVSLDFVIRDPDLQWLRESLAHDPDWAALDARLQEACSEAAPFRVPIPPPPAGRVPVAPRPWNPWFRVTLGLLVLAVLGFLLYQAVTNDAHWIFRDALIAAIAVAAFRLGFAIRDLVVAGRLSGTPDQNRVDVATNGGPPGNGAPRGPSNTDSEPRSARPDA